MSWDAVISGISSFIGGERANEANLSNSRESDARSSVEAQKQRDFQERMSNSEVQRRKEDLTKAGFNPLLAAETGASTPSGAMGSTSTAKAENTIAPAITSAFEAKRMGMEIQNQTQDLALKKAQTTEAAMRTAVMSKEIPKAEIVNEAYSLGKKIINNVKGIVEGNPAYVPRTNPNLESYKKGMEKMKKEETQREEEYRKWQNQFKQTNPQNKRIP